MPYIFFCHCAVPESIPLQQMWPLWKFPHPTPLEIPVTLHTFLSALQKPHPQEIPIPSTGEVWISFATAHSNIFHYLFRSLSLLTSSLSPILDFLSLSLPCTTLLLYYYYIFVCICCLLLIWRSIPAKIQCCILHSTFRFLSYIYRLTSEFTLSSFNFPPATFKFLHCTFTFLNAIYWSSCSSSAGCTSKFLHSILSIW